MYGFPLTIYILSWLFDYQNPLTRTEGHILSGIIGENIFFFHPLSIMMSMGLFLVFFGWQQIHGRSGQLVTEGIYAYIRHPHILEFYC